MDIHKATNTPHLYTRAEAYGIPGFYCKDGNDVMAFMKQWARLLTMYVVVMSAIVEVESYRWFGHSTADAGVYRTKEEVDEWKNNNDPIIRYRDYLVSENIASVEELDAIQSQVKAEVDAAYEFAQNSPDPELSVAFEDVWVD